MKPATETPIRITPGRYRLYKGNEYQVIALARQIEADEEMVIYRCLYGDHSLRVRPLPLFRDTVVLNGRQIMRFTPMAEPAEGQWR